MDKFTIYLNAYSIVHSLIWLSKCLIIWYNQRYNDQRRCEDGPTEDNVINRIYGAIWNRGVMPSAFIQYEMTGRVCMDLEIMRDSARRKAG